MLMHETVIKRLLAGGEIEIVPAGQGREHATAWITMPTAKSIGQVPMALLAKLKKWAFLIATDRTGKHPIEPDTWRWNGDESLRHFNPGGLQ